VAFARVLRELKPFIYSLQPLENNQKDQLRLKENTIFLISQLAFFHYFQNSERWPVWIKKAQPGPAHFFHVNFATIICHLPLPDRESF
jgi:hypothetical protein